MGYGWRGSEYKDAVRREFSGNVHSFLFPVCGDGYKNLCKYKNSVLYSRKVDFTLCKCEK